MLKARRCARAADGESRAHHASDRTGAREIRRAEPATQIATARRHRAALRQQSDAGDSSAGATAWPRAWLLRRPMKVAAVVVRAPAGLGKTTMVLEAIAECDTG